MTDTKTLLDAARDLFEPVDRAAADTPAGEPVPRAVMDQLADAGLHGLLTPKAVGGFELPLVDVIDLYAEVSRADGSTGWCLFASDATTSYFGAYLPDDGVADIFADGVPIMAGQFAPNGTALLDGDDLVVTGDYQFGSGIAHAAWAGAGVLTVPDDETVPAGLLFACFPVEEADLRGNWDVLGLQATASYDYQVRDVVVPGRHAFDFFAPNVYRGNDVYRMGVLPLTAAGHAGWALGVTRRILDELASIAAGTLRLGASSSLADSERFLFEYGRLEGRYLAGAALVRQVFTDAVGEVERDGVLSDLTAALTREACRHVNQGGADIAREAYLLAGTRGLRDGPIQRCFRDLHAGSQHFFASPAAAIDFGRARLDDLRPA